jgi:putative transposase
VRITRWSNCYQSRRDPQSELRVRLRDLASTRIRYGYRRLTVLLRREGWPVNTKRVYRLYREEGLGLRMKKRAKKAAANQAGGSALRESTVEHGLFK